MKLKLKKRVQVVEENVSTELEATSVVTRLPIDSIEKNLWNMNSMEPSAFRKLKAWIERSFSESGRLALPVVVRTHPTLPGKWEIIDGYHRWKACQELKKTEVDVWVYECDDKAARLLTDALNYLRGSPNPEKYVDYLKSLSEVGVGRDEIAQFTHMTAQELDEFSSTYEVKLEDVPTTDDPTKQAEEQDAAKDPDEWIEMKFLVPRTAAEVIEAELARIGDTLTGKNVRGRALEFAMVQSAQTPLSNVVPTEPEKQLSKTKAKLGMLAGKRRRAADVDQ